MHFYRCIFFIQTPHTRTPTHNRIFKSKQTNKQGKKKTVKNANDAPAATLMAQILLN